MSELSGLLKLIRHALDTAQQGLERHIRIGEPEVKTRETLRALKAAKQSLQFVQAAAYVLDDHPLNGDLLTVYLNDFDTAIQVPLQDVITALKGHYSESDVEIVVTPVGMIAPYPPEVNE